MEAAGRRTTRQQGGEITRNDNVSGDFEYFSKGSLRAACLSFSHSFSYPMSLTCSQLFFLLTVYRLGTLSKDLVFVMFYSELYRRLIHCLADGRNKRKIKLPPSETIQSQINSGEFTSPSETAAAAFSVEDACRHFDGLEVNVGVKGASVERREWRREKVGVRS